MRCGTRRPFGPSFDQGDRQGFVPSPVNLLLTKAFDGTGRNVCVPAPPVSFYR